MPALFEFVKDRAPQGGITGPFAPVADQTKFKSIYGVVSGPQTGPFTAQQIENGQIYSGDGRARMGGEAVRNEDGTFHDVQSGSTVFREFQVPNEMVEAWNAHERSQSDAQCKAISQKAFGDNVKPTESITWDETIEAPSIKYQTTGTVVSPGLPETPKPTKRRGRPPKATQPSSEPQPT